MSLTPLEFEQLCLSQMRLEGWVGKSTPATSDQGADVICDHGAIRAVIQCKLYDRPVGNSAVQEAISARIFYEANIAAVVTNASFTKSAIQLAAKAKVSLLQQSQLRQWAKLNKSKSAVDHSQLATIREIIDALNLHGYSVRKTGNATFSVSTPNGLTYVNGEGALHGLATRLLRVEP